MNLLLGVGERGRLIPGRIKLTCKIAPFRQQHLRVLTSQLNEVLYQPFEKTILHAALKRFKLP